MPEISQYQLRKLRKSARQVQQLNESYDQYQDALRQRKHGGVAADNLIYALSQTLGRDGYEFERPASPKKVINGRNRT